MFFIKTYELVHVEYFNELIENFYYGDLALSKLGDDYFQKTYPKKIEEAKQELAPLLCGTINMAKALSKPTFAIFSPIINVDAWHLDKDPKHQAVHLKSFCPDCFKDSQENSVASLYKKFHPNFFIEKFKTFLSKF